MSFFVSWLGDHVVACKVFLSRVFDFCGILVSGSQENPFEVHEDWQALLEIVYRCSWNVAWSAPCLFNYFQVLRFEEFSIICNVMFVFECAWLDYASQRFQRAALKHDTGPSEKCKLCVGFTCGRHIEEEGDYDILWFDWIWFLYNMQWSRPIPTTYRWLRFELRGWGLWFNVGGSSRIHWKWHGVATSCPWIQVDLDPEKTLVCLRVDS